MEGPGALQGKFRVFFGSFLAPFWVKIGSVLAHFRSRGGPGEAPGTQFSKVLFWGFCLVFLRKNQGGNPLIDFAKFSEKKLWVDIHPELLLGIS